ncbi:uncharacterized protein LY89DRAFT_590926 [Mollisia scopiformis]|uniref:FAR-17a/AIG1-like protein n=1 Tax=Mollisia scopiformis TaxID=149040 RepID=A0A194X1N7_MOLSC|nr:uncharacterized protein LY89DRAFT_590926 [Mollisia scopiformis]KUJ14111.1 hypothetical protein LY89DRAFT_590926 [Mollisia scopiformis]
MTTPTQYTFTSSRSLRALSFSIHVTGLMFFAASFWWLPNITNPLHNGFGGSYQFLTIIALTISTITFGVGFLANLSLFADLSLGQQLFAVKNWLSICATPLEVLVTILYWTLRTIDKKLVVPPDHEVPFIPDFGFHAIPALMLTLDLMALSPPWSMKILNVVLLDLVLTFSYWSWIEYCFSVNGWYPYPLLGSLSVSQKLLLSIVSAALMTGSTMVLESVHERVDQLIWRNTDIKSN